MVPDAAPAAQAPQAQQAQPQGFDSLVDDSQAQQNQYGTPEQQRTAAVEGLGRGFAGPLATYAEKHIYRIPEKDIRGRQEANPVTAGVGEGVGLLGGAITGTGEAAALEAVGKGATELAGLSAPATYASRVGSSIVKNAAEMAAYQSQDEVGKMILDDPDAGAQSAISNIGLAAVLGGGAGGFITGAVSPLWSATVGSKGAQGLKALVSRIGGIEGEEAAGKAAGLAEKAGVELPPEVSSVINDMPMARENHSILSQDDSSMAGRAYQDKLHKLDSELGAKTAEALGKTPEDILNVPEKNHYETGQNAGMTLHDELKPTVSDINSRYEATTNSFKQKPTYEVIPQIADELAQKTISEGWAKSSDESNHKLVEKVLGKLSDWNTVNDLKLEISNLYRPYDAPDFKAAMEVKKILTKGMESAIEKSMGPQELKSYSQLRQNYAQLMSHLEDLDTHLHVGKWNGPGTFLEALKEKANQKGENLLSNMTGKNNAALLDTLQSHPKTLAAISEHYKDSLVRDATKNTNPGELIKTNRLLKGIENLSPQQKALVTTPAQQERLEAINSIKDNLNDPKHNFSNTARTLRKHAAGAVSPLSLLAVLMGHGDAGILSYLGSLGFNEVRPGLKLATMKMLGSTKPVDAAGFSAAAKFFGAATAGGKVLSTASENVFKPGLKVLNTSQQPSAISLDKLDKLVASNDADHNNKLMASAEDGKLGHYMPDHQTALTGSSMQALEYLRQLKPKTEPTSPLGTSIKASPAEETRYNRALTIAQQPAVVLQHVKDGTIQPSDISDLNTMYPALYKQLSQKVSNDMMDAKSKGVQIPYNTRMGVSLFLGQPLDPSMQPQSILAAQPKPQQAPQQPNQPMKDRKGKSAIDKLSKDYKTQGQAAESDRSNRD